MSSSTRRTSSTSRRRICATMPPTVCSSSRAGSTTLIRRAPLACTTRCSVHDVPRLLRRDSQFHISGSTPAGVCSSASRMGLEIPLTSASNPPKRVAYRRRARVPLTPVAKPGEMNLGSLHSGVCGSRRRCRAPRAPSRRTSERTARRGDRPGGGSRRVLCRNDGRRSGFGPGEPFEYIAGCGVCLCAPACPWPRRGTGAPRGRRIVRREAAGLDAPTAERIADAARKAGVVTAVGHHWRYSPAVDLVRELLDGRPVRLVAGSWIDRVPPVPWWSKRALSGGQIVEQAVHVLDLIRLLCGDVVEVNAYANAAPPSTPDADVDGATVAILQLQSGAVGTVTAACCVDWKHRAGLELHADGLSVTFREDCVTARTARGTMQRSLLPDDAKRAADRAFIDAVVGNGAVSRRSSGGLRRSPADPPISLRHSDFRCSTTVL